MQEASFSYSQQDAEAKTSVGEVSPQIGAVSLYEDPDSQLGLRGSSISKPRTVSELHARWNELPDDVRERVVHELKVGRPRPCVDEYGEPRFPTAEEVGIHKDERGYFLVSPDDPTLRDRDLDEYLLEKSPEEMLEVMDARIAGEGEDRDDPAFYEELMKRENVDPSGGGGSKGTKKKRPAPTSIIDRTAAYASEKSIER